MICLEKKAKHRKRELWRHGSISKEALLVLGSSIWVSNVLWLPELQQQSTTDTKGSQWGQMLGKAFWYWSSSSNSIRSPLFFLIYFLLVFNLLTYIITPSARHPFTPTPPPSSPEKSPIQTKPLKSSWSLIWGWGITLNKMNWQAENKWGDWQGETSMRRKYSWLRPRAW